MAVCLLGGVVEGEEAGVNRSRAGINCTAAVRAAGRYQLLSRCTPGGQSAQVKSFVRAGESCPYRRIEHSSAEAIVLFHQPPKVRTAELTANRGGPIQQLGFKRREPQPAPRLLHALDPGALLAQ
jgi:hypothetical protein